MERLTLEHICGYLPYGLKIANKSLKRKLISIYKMEVENDKDRGIMNVINGVNQIPILYPMSDLTKEYNCKVPLIELAKILKSSWDWYLELSLRGSAACCKIAGTIYYFECDEEGFCFYNKIDGHLFVVNQLTLLQYLYKNKFDIHGLIKKGLAIDVNTLETNPYEL